MTEQWDCDRQCHLVCKFWPTLTCGNGMKWCVLMPAVQRSLKMFVSFVCVQECGHG